MTENPSISVLALYGFAPIADPQALRDQLRQICEHHGVKGTLLIAQEGINGTIAGSEAGLLAVLREVIAALSPHQAMQRWSNAAEMPFKRLKVKVKREIVTMGQPLTSEARGSYVKPADWDALIANPAVKLIDVRNDFEIAQGSFAGAIDPATRSFGAFPAWLDDFASTITPDTPVAMFCTGGIRCEKATAYARTIGLTNVHHLEGGILAYLEQKQPGDGGSFAGRCFVFDEREGLGPALQTVPE